MSIEQTQVVDYAGIERHTGCALLTVVDHLDWSDEQKHLLLLEEKLNRYLQFIESGQLFEHVEVARSAPIKVSVLAKFEAPLRAREFLIHARQVFASAGFALEWKHLREPQ